MSNSASISVFNFEKSQVRIVSTTSQQWFIAKDVCDILGLKNTTEAVRSLDGDEKSNFRISDVAGGRENIVVSESGLYALIMRSNKPNAKRFRKWVTSEVLPSIRKTGAYGAQVKGVPQDLLEIAKLAVAAAEAERERAKVLASENEKIKPLAKYATDVLSSHDLITINAIAGEIGISAVSLNQFLKETEILYKRGELYYEFSQWRGLGLFGYSTHRYAGRDGGVHVAEHLKVTQKGRAFILELWKSQGEESPSATYRRMFERSVMIPCSAIGVNILTDKIDSDGIFGAIPCDESGRIRLGY